MAAILDLRGIILTKILLFYHQNNSYTTEIKNAWILNGHFFEKRQKGQENQHFPIFLDFHLGLVFVTKSLISQPTDKLWSKF